jgi:hypothetical protein
MVVYKSIVDSVMSGDGIKSHLTNKDTRVINFMEAAGMHPKTCERMDEKDHVLMVRTSGEFINRVTSIGEIIIRDHFKALCDRIFKPADMGGIAGGTKYIVDGLLFKFADPAEGPYLGSYELANKATGHDLRCVLCSAYCTDTLVSPSI